MIEATWIFTGGAFIVSSIAWFIAQKALDLSAEALRISKERLEGEK